MYLGSDNYLGATAYLGPGPNGDIEPVGDETLIQWRDITLHGMVGRFTIRDLVGWDDLPDSRQQWDPRPNQHGSFDAPVLSGERHIMVAGACFDRAQRDQLLAEMKRAMTFGAHAEELAITHAGQRLTVAARLVRFNATHPAWGAGYWGWQAEWVAPDPYRYGAKRMAYTGLPVKRGGLRYPLYTDGTSTSTVYAWTGTPGASTSTKSVDGVVVAENLCPNPSVEADASGWGPNAQGGHTLVRSTDEAWSGSASALVTVGSFGPNLGARYRLPDPGIPAGTTVTVSCYAKVAPGAPTPTGADVLYRDDNAGSTYLTSPATMTDEGDGWVRISHTHTVPSGLHLTSPYFVLRNVGGWSAGQQAYFDACLIEEGATLGDYFDGGTPDETVYGGTGILDYGEASDSGRVTLRNDGDADAWPTFAVRGPAPQGATITNIETGRRIVSTTVIPSGSTLTIHTANGTAYLDGADRSGQLTVREWTPVPPGGSYMFQFNAPTYTGAGLVSSIRDTYW